MPGLGLGTGLGLEPGLGWLHGACVRAKVGWGSMEPDVRVKVGWAKVKARVTATLARTSHVSPRHSWTTFLIQLLNSASYAQRRVK